MLVVVTRWYGGVHLSSDRFKDINYVRSRGRTIKYVLSSYADGATWFAS